MLGPAVLGWGSAASAQTIVVQPAPAPAPAPETLPAPAPAPVPLTLGVTQAQPASPELAPPEVATVPSRVVATEWRPNRSMLTIGFFTFGQAYIASIGIAATSSTPGDSNLWIPVLGPWLDLGARPGCPSSSTQCGTQNGYKVLLAVDGILQTFGAFQLAGAFLWPEVVTVTRVVATASGASVSLAPGPGYGLAAVGHF